MDQLEIQLKCLQFVINNTDIGLQNSKITDSVLEDATKLYKWVREMSDPSSKINNLTKGESIRLIADALRDTIDKFSRSAFKDQ